ncbi:t-complex 1 [Fusarium longipes]|uniref:T-complex 1 n=1 Tax=Fusarium longipes TaxID=694270 RepID=A0A395RQJ7_9HYPO|nr:t-complex 1 [Fusarium longipes]
MARGNAANYSRNEESDPGVIGIQAQNQLIQLKKERNDRMSEIVQETATEMANLRSRAAAFQQDRRTTELEVVASAVARVMEAIERRKDIEQQMKTLVDQVGSSAQAIEEMMKMGFKGREDDVKKTRY